MIKPITPRGAVANKESIPDAVIQAFNNLIIETLFNGRAVFSQQVVVTRMISMGVPKDDIYKKHYLDVEYIYTQAGWVVKYDKSGPDEEGDGTFTFIAK